MYKNENLSVFSKVLTLSGYLKKKKDKILWINNARFIFFI